MKLDFPIRFVPLFRDYLWGGSRLSEILHKRTGPGTWAESWEVVDHPNGQSLVLDGPFAGLGLHELMQRFGKDLIGEEAWERTHQPEIPIQLQGRFPILFKYLDAKQDLSVQVHPSDISARLQSPPDLGKTEAWYVVHANPGSRIYAGLNPGVDRSKFLAALSEHKIAETLHSFAAAPGQCILVPAGTIHAIGAGVLIAEIQQASDTTFRIHDWDRTGADGMPRPLHLEQALNVIDFERGPIFPVFTRVCPWQTLARCDYFSLSLYQVSKPSQLCGDGRLHLVSVLEGDLIVEELTLKPGDTVLFPAAMKAIELTPALERTTFLEVQLP